VAREAAVIALTLGLACLSLVPQDLDGDGVLEEDGDCAPLDPGVYTGATEIWYDGVDQDCDGNDADQDGDGADADHVGGIDCWDDPGTVPDDFAVVSPEWTQPSASEVHPGAPDTWYDGVDQDCNGRSDFDVDRDLHDSDRWPQRDGTVGLDCVDNPEDLTAALDQAGLDSTELAPADIHPDVPPDQDTCYDGLNQDCDTRQPATDNPIGDGWDSDADCDRDGWMAAQECDDTDPELVPVSDVTDPPYDCIDQDCDANDGDADRDGFLAAGYPALCPDWEALHATAHRSLALDDCWDDPASSLPEHQALNGLAQPTADEVWPGAVDAWYDGVDADCTTDDDFDADRDGERSSAWPDRDGATGPDCDDGDATVSTAAAELCDGVDRDCDGTVDEDGADDAPDWFLDADADGFGDPWDGTPSCTEPSGRVSDDTDCDDSDPSTNPAATEICEDGIDQDCDGTGLGCAWSTLLAVDAADVTMVGHDAGDQSGGVLARIGDIDGTGRTAIAVGAWSYNGDSTDRGAAYVVVDPSGPSHDLSSDSQAVLAGGTTDEHVGRALAGGGDVDGDGLADLLIGAPGYGYDDGAVYLVTALAAGSDTARGAASGVIDGGSLERLGAAVALLGDQDGDGLDEVVSASVPMSTGFIVYLHLGPLSGAVALEDYDALIHEPGSGTLELAALHGEDDLNGDGQGDLVISGVPATSHTGRIWVFLQPVTGQVDADDADGVYSGIAGHSAGAAIDCGDVDGDGRSDLIVGAPADDDAGTDAGAVTIIPGPASATTSLTSLPTRILGASTDQAVGAAVAALGDVDGDGFGDLAIGGPLATGVEADAGMTWIFYGPLSGTLDVDDAQAAFEGLEEDDESGGALLGDLDLDGDGFGDLLIGADHADEGSGDAGTVSVFWGSGL